MFNFLKFKWPESQTLYHRYSSKPSSLLGYFDDANRLNSAKSRIDSGTFSFLANLEKPIGVLSGDVGIGVVPADDRGLSSSFGKRAVPLDVERGLDREEMLLALKYHSSVLIS